ncbi:glutathione S-transferase [Salmonella enterica subsp. enterica serovar Enteritidis str. EC20120929]|uniref:glutathione binding-like protein n=1 Tax=Salmonella enterica TaxID=28901 RepID=UPI0007787D10|nr:glutathione binding-like protein [Salmonella enterica]AHV45475.2 glutathione S-transferase [Salmonella enterica subsp. enterica serovar Enteritidis str. EC20120929]
MKLFYKPGACSLASHITLREIGKDFTLDGVDLAKKRLENGDDYLAVNPKGQVPALLLDDGTLLTEGVAIMQNWQCSFARSDPPHGPSQTQTELHKGFTPLFRPDTPETLKPAVRAALEKKFQYVDESLSDDQWICGQRFTIADAYLFTVLRWAYGVKLNMDGLTHIESYMQRVAKRPTVAAALKAEGLN